jgi:hypothetical protein
VKIGALAAAALLLAGCGATSPSPAQRVKSTAHAYFAALGKRNYQAACDQTSTTFQQAAVKNAAPLGARTCADALKIGLGSAGRDELDPLLTDKIIVLTLSGSHATTRRAHGTDVMRLHRYGTTYNRKGKLPAV